MARIETRDARRKLAARREPYWRAVTRGIAIGYGKAPGGTASWFVRKFLARASHPKGGVYVKARIGETDDEYPADGTLRLSWADALRQVTSEEKDIKLRLHYTVQDVFDDYFRQRAASAQASAAEADRDRIQAFLEKYGDRRAADITADDLRAWRNSQIPHAKSGQTQAEEREAKRRAQASANRKWSIVRAGFNHGFRNEWIASEAAWRRIKPFPNVERAKTRFLSVKEAESLLATCRADFRPLAHAALLTGMRLGELLSLTVADVNNVSISVPPGKTGRGRVVPLATAEAKALFASLANGKKRNDALFLAEDGTPWIKMQVGRRMARASKRAELDPPATFHDLRRTVGSWLANAGVADSVIATVLGHQDTRMTRRHYAHLMQQTVADQMAAHLPALAPAASRRHRTK